MSISLYTGDRSCARDQLRTLIILLYCLLSDLHQGRSPYESGLHHDESYEGRYFASEGEQDYDHAGRPINSASERFANDQVRAANEVLETAGIIENTLIVKAKELRLAQLKDRESGSGLGVLGLARESLVFGVWGVCGLPKRIMVRQYAISLGSY
jgi:hypothetical protein